jgi:Uma2 family endonuclease
VISATLPQITLRSLDATWNRSLWEQLPNDGNRYEVIDGILYMTTVPSTFHQWIVRQIMRLFFTTIDDQGVGLTVFSPIELFMPGCDPVQPDIIVVRFKDLHIFHDRRINGVPTLLIEVLSPSNAVQDTETKRDAYARAGVPEYWIVDPRHHEVVIFSARQDAGTYAQQQRFGADEELISPTLPIRTQVEQLFVGAPDTTL